MDLNAISKEKLLRVLSFFLGLTTVFFLTTVPFYGMISFASQPLLTAGLFLLSLLLSFVILRLIASCMCSISLCVFSAAAILLLLGAGIANLRQAYVLCGSMLMLILMGFYFGLCALIWKVTGLYYSFQKGEGWACCAIALLLGLFVIGLFNHERFIYYWDFSGYWTMALDTSRYICQNPQDGLRWLYTSICVDEYNRWIPLLLGIPLQILGQTYGAYIASLFLCFLMPTAATYAALTQALMSKRGEKRIHTTYLFLFYALSGALLLPSLNGYADAACVLFIAMLTALAVYTDLTRFHPLSITLMGLSIAHLALMRRSYDYWIITFAIACFILVFAQLFHKKEQERWDALKGALSNLAVLFGLGALIVFCFFEYFRSALSLNVRFAYQAWSITVGQNAWLDFLRNYGWILLFAVVAGIFFVRRASCMQKRAILICCVCVGLLMVKNMSDAGFISLHSYYWITGQFLLMAGMGLYGIYDQLGKRLDRYFLTCMAVFIGVGFFHTVHIVTIPSILQPLFPAKYYEVKYSDTKDDVMSVLNAIRLLPEAAPTVYVLGTDSEFNDDILRNALLPDRFDDAHIFTTAHVDFREGFYTDLLDADYVLTISPTEYHLGTEFQQVVAIPSQLLEDESSFFSHCYEDIATVPFGDRSVKIKKKIKPIDLDSVRELETEFNSVYPDHPELFYDRLEQYIVDNNLA